MKKIEGRHLFEKIQYIITVAFGLIAKRRLMCLQWLSKKWVNKSY